jgi:cytochrome b561
MQWRSTNKDWGAAAKFLHWAMAACIMIMIVMGIMMKWYLAGDQARQFQAYQLHKSFGFLLLLFALARLLWRLSAKAVPAAPVAAKPHERWLANGVLQRMAPGGRRSLGAASNSARLPLS